MWYNDLRKKLFQNSENVRALADPKYRNQDLKILTHAFVGAGC